MDLTVGTHLFIISSNRKKDDRLICDAWGSMHHICLGILGQYHFAER